MDIPSEHTSSELSFSHLASSAVATFIITPEHKVVFWNKACESLTGVTSSEVMHTDEHWKAFYPTKRPCLVDIVIDGTMEELPNLYVTYSRSLLAPDGINAEGWFEDLGGEKRYIIFDAVPIYNKSGELVAAIETLNDITKIKTGEEEREKLISSLKENVANNSSLKGYLPLCSSCKKIRDMEGEWQSFECYFQKNFDILFSHGICPTCVEELYPDFSASLKK